MPLRFPETGDSDEVVGQTPWSARVPLDPLFCNEISLIESQRADEGVGRGPGGPPHKLSELSGSGRLSGIGMASCPTIFLLEMSQSGGAGVQPVCWGGLLHL